MTRHRVGGLPGMACVAMVVNTSVNWPDMGSQSGLNGQGRYERAIFGWEDMSVNLTGTSTLAGRSGLGARSSAGGRAGVAALALAALLGWGTATSASEIKGAGAAPPAGTTGVPVEAATGKDGVIADGRTGDLTEQIMSLRRKMTDAVAKKDRATLEKLYHERFTHLRETGRAETRKERIDFLLAGNAGIELASADQALIETYSPDTAVLSGVSVISIKGRRKPDNYQWLTLYVRDKNGHWQAALSQANRLPKPE